MIIVSSILEKSNNFIYSQYFCFSKIMIITITGDLGSGKSSVGKILAKTLGYKFYSMGDIIGEVAKERGMTINELQEIQETDKTIDTDMDNYQRKLGKNSNNFIMDSRLGFHFIPNSIRLFLKVDIKEGARRILIDPRDDEFHAKDINHQIELIKRRMESEKKRYQQYYGIDPRDESHYDFVVDTTTIPKEEVVKKILEYLKKSKAL